MEKHSIFEKEMLEHYIYKDGYGPGHVTLAEYMQSVMPGRFGNTANNGDMCLNGNSHCGEPLFA